MSQTAICLFVVAFVLFCFTLPSCYSLYVLLRDGRDAYFTRFSYQGTGAVSVRATDDLRLRFNCFAGGAACCAVGLLLRKSVRQK